MEIKPINLQRPKNFLENNEEICDIIANSCKFYLENDRRSVFTALLRFHSVLINNRKPFLDSYINDTFLLVLDSFINSQEPKNAEICLDIIKKMADLVGFEKMCLFFSDMFVKRLIEMFYKVNIVSSRVSILDYIKYVTNTINDSNFRIDNFIIDAGEIILTSLNIQLCCIYSQFLYETTYRKGTVFPTLKEILKHLLCINDTKTFSYALDTLIIALTYSYDDYSDSVCIESMLDSPSSVIVSGALKIILSFVLKIDLFNIKWKIVKCLEHRSPQCRLLACHIIMNSSELFQYEEYLIIDKLLKLSFKDGYETQVSAGMAISKMIKRINNLDFSRLNVRKIISALNHISDADIEEENLMIINNSLEILNNTT